MNRDITIHVDIDLKNMTYSSESDRQEILAFCEDAAMEQKSYVAQIEFTKADHWVIRMIFD